MWHIWAMSVILFYIGYSYLNDEMKERFYEELEHVFDEFPKYYMKILLRDFNAKVGRKFAY
jgi:hypothetical protein